MLRGNLAPGGAIIKQCGGQPGADGARGPRASCSRTLRTWRARIDDPDLDVEADDILVLKSIGPMGAPGMPEAGYMPIPRKLAAAGRQGHGAHLRRRHERHGVRHHRAARHA